MCAGTAQAMRRQVAQRIESLFVLAEPEPICGAVRTPGSERSPVCELPPDHILKGEDHFGRSRSGRWFGWAEHIK